MITEDEKRWLDRRKNPCNRCGFQKRCSWKSENIPCEKWGLFQIKAWGTKSGDVEHKFRDAAEFEARVALELTDFDASYLPLCPDNCRSRRGCRECQLMHARLAVEAEMDK